MSQTYDALLRGDRLVWQGQAPPPSGGDVQVKVTVVQPEPAQPADNRSLVELFEELARRGNLDREIPDPVAWQREIRKDRPLPGRD